MFCLVTPISMKKIAAMQKARKPTDIRRSGNKRTQAQTVMAGKAEVTQVNVILK